jgi:hypothetical protein
MASSTPGRRKVREYVPPHLRDAMTVTRLANADEMRKGGPSMRYVVVCNVHEGIDPDLPIRILDSQAAEHNLRMETTSSPEYLYVADLLERLPARVRKHFLRN